MFIRDNKAHTFKYKLFYNCWKKTDICEIEEEKASEK
jgi:hypothetical protein